MITVGSYEAKTRPFSPHDAFCLELAMSRCLALATLNGVPENAAIRAGVELYQP